MPPDADLVRIRHMVDAAATAIAFVDGRTRGDLDADVMLLMALTRAVEIVGEAATKVGAATRAELPGVPWHDIVATRHRLAHGYFDINADILWATVADDLPPLVAELRGWLARQ